MSCPFLREGRARYCHAAPVRKLILDGPGATDGGRCASSRYRTCELAAKEEADQSRCPHLEEMRVQYCGVSPIPKLVPCSESQLQAAPATTIVTAIPTCISLNRTRRNLRRICCMPRTISGWIRKSRACATSAWTVFSRTLPAMWTRSHSLRRAELTVPPLP